MSARAEFDVGPLSWVKGEIDHAIEHAQEALRAFAANSADAAQLKTSQSHLHQAHGALSIVGLEGITRVSEELEGLLGAVEKEVPLRKAEVFGLIERALGGIRAYLDQLMAGRPNQPLRLFPLYRDVVSARGGRADPTDLYYPNLSFRPPKRDKGAGIPKPGEADKHLREQRGRYQRGLLKWLKKDPSGAQDMRAAVEAIEGVQGPGAQRAFWWVALAFFDALAQGALPSDLDTKQLCNRIEQQIKRLVEGAPSVAERLMREVLYYVARAKPTSDLVRDVQEAYHLAQSIPQTDGEEAAAEDSPALKAAREHLAHAKDAWNKFASGNSAALAARRAVRKRGSCGSYRPSRGGRRVAGLERPGHERGDRPRGRDCAPAIGERPCRNRSLGRVCPAGPAAGLETEGRHAGQAPAHGPGHPPARRDVAKGAGTPDHEPGGLGDAG
jgi:chemosensory pili system protein ChpA (sensor histidine kinase/response regulator)